MLLRPPDLDRLVRASAAALREGGVRAGEVVAFRAAPGADTLAALVAVWRLGALAAPISPHLPDADVPGLLRSVGAERLREVPTLAAGGDAPLAPWANVPDAAPALFVFTSGSTGAPKAARLSAGALRASASGVNERLGFTGASAWLLALPLFHVGGVGVVVRALEAGGALVVSPAGAPLAHALATPGLTHASLVGAQLHRLLRDAPAVLDGKTLLLGGSAMPPALLDAAHARGLRVATGYGLTEMASTVTATAPGAPRDDLATAGHVLPGGRLRISAAGEIEVGGATRFDGYATDAGFVRPFSADGFFATGDLGALDAEGRLVVEGRRDLRFTVGGENVQPEAVERALGALPSVREAVVVPVPDAEYGARPFAFVGADGPLDPAALRDALRERLPGLFVPVGFAAIPEGPGLKPSRRALAALAALQRAG